MGLPEFRRCIRDIEAFRHVVIGDLTGNLLSVSGDVIGRATYDQLIELGRQHGIVVLTDRLSIWESQAYFDEFKDAPVHEVRRTRPTERQQ